MMGIEQIVEYVIIFVIAFIIAFSATPIAKKISAVIGAVDIPNDNRRMHKKPMARLGGLAIIAGFVFAILFLIVSYSFAENGKAPLISISRQLVGICAGMLIIIAMGIIDDIKSIEWPKTKFFLQLLAALSVVFIGGMRIERLSNPFSPAPYFGLPGPVSVIITILWIIGITNAINLIDGLDGLASGVTAISSISLFFIMMVGPEANYIPLVAVMTLALAGSTLGFLPFNFYPSRIIMGDTGAYFLGYILAVISLQGAMKSYTAISLAVPILVLGLPVFDTASSFIRRIFNGKSFMRADRGHIHHRLIDMGLSHRQSVVVMYTGSAALGLIAIVMSDKGALSAAILLVLLSAFIIGGAFFMKDINNNEMLTKNKDMKDKDDRPEENKLLGEEQS